jgi:pimeloyl-ACP methyl ester carboxylesterase
MSAEDVDTTDVITIEDIIERKLDHIKCVRRDVIVRGMAIATFTFTDERLADEVHKTPVLGLHGGPSFCHNYISPLKLLAEHGHPVILYDQCGCGESRNGVGDPEAEPEKHGHLLNIAYYVEECTAVAQQLHLDSFYLYGSSWGSMLAQECAVAWAQERSPGSSGSRDGDGGGGKVGEEEDPFITVRGALKGLILDATFCDADTYIQTQWRDRQGKYPTFMQKQLRRFTDEKRYTCKAYKAMSDIFTTAFTLRVVPYPVEFKASMQGCNDHIYVKMQGASEFTIGGVLEKWSIKDRLGVVQVPVLILRGEFDTMTEEASQQTADALTNAWPVVVVPRASHCKLLEEPEICIEAMAKFLRAVDAGLGPVEEE